MLAALSRTAGVLVLRHNAAQYHAIHHLLLLQHWHHAGTATTQLALDPEAVTHMYTLVVMCTLGAAVATCVCACVNAGGIKLRNCGHGYVAQQFDYRHLLW